MRRAADFSRSIDNMPRPHPYSAAPVLNLEYWSLSINRAGKPPLLLTLEELLVLPTVERECALVCARQELRDARSVRWRGISLASILDSFRGRFIRLSAANNYTTVTPAGSLQQAILAVERDGQPLTAQQGAPVRLIVPGAASFKSVKWLRRIECVDAPAGGFWESRGWPLDGRLRPQVAFTMPHHQAAGELVIGGIAFAGDEPVSGVQVSIDGGDWLDTRIVPHAPGALAHWSMRWYAPAPTALSLRARIVDAEFHSARSVRSLFARASSHEAVLIVTDAA